MTSGRQEDAAAPQGRALVVDDDPTNRRLLNGLLQREGYQVAVAEDGEQALARFQEFGPDIVFMDVMMPRMDGYDATRRIKALAGDRFVPVIFLTALTDEEALAKCVEVGGDDFLTKPFRRTILRARILAMDRIRRLYEQVKTQRDELRVLHARLQREEEIAEEIFSGAVSAENVRSDRIRSLLRSTGTFNGDLLLTARKPSGGLNVLLGDFTGHGLAAAIGALPVSEVFRAMTAKGFAPSEVVREINHKLKTLLPTGMFMAAVFASLNENGSATVFNAGMPEVLVLGADAGDLRYRFGSTHPPLGVLEPMDGGAWQRFEYRAGDRLILCSDGVIESKSPTGELFGQARLEALVSAGAEPLPQALTAALEAFTQGAPQADDVSLVEVVCAPETPAPDLDSAVRVPAAAPPGVQAGSWRWSLELRGAALSQVDPVPLAIGFVQELPSVRDQRRSLFTVLSELFNNALDHGVLALDSALKQSADGFACYYAERGRRLAALHGGFVRMELELTPLARGGRVAIRLRDSGQGFDADATRERSGGGLSGQGLALVRRMCESVRFNEAGNEVEAVYAWQ